MNDLKPFFLCVFFVLVTSTLYTQNFKVKGGLSLASVSFSENASFFEQPEVSPEKLPAFHLGVGLEFPLGNILSIQTGVTYQNRGFKSEITEVFEGVEITGEGELKSSYIDIPLTLKASHDLGNTTIYVFGGGYAGIGISAQSESRASALRFSTSTSIEWQFGEDGDFNRWDYGALVGAGVQFNSVFLEFSYGLGLANIFQDPIADETMKNRLISVSAGYRFIK